MIRGLPLLSGDAGGHAERRRVRHDRHLSRITMIEAFVHRHKTLMKQPRSRHAPGVAAFGSRD
jgi:hypothetical protein